MELSIYDCVFAVQLASHKEKVSARSVKTGAYLLSGNRD